MPQSVFDQELAQNRQAYGLLRERILREFAGQYVAIAFGGIVAVSPDYSEVRTQVERMKPAPEHFVIFPAAQEPAWEPYDSISSEYL